MLGDARNNIKFIAVARASDRVMVSSYVHQKGDHNLDQYHNAVQEVLSAPDFQYKVTPGSRYRLVGDINSFNFTIDQQNRVYIVITVTEYPERLVFLLVNELIPMFSKDFGEKSLTCGENSLSRKAESLFSKLANEYDDPSKKDKVAKVQQQVNDVKFIMHKNIDGMLQNIDKASKIEADTKALQDQAKMFEKQAGYIKRREQCKNWKLTAIISGTILLVVIILIISMTRGSGDSGGN